MILLVKAHREELTQLDLVATRGTSKLVQARVGLLVTLMESGPRGGDQQIGALVANGDVRAVISLRDTLTAQPHEPDIWHCCEYVMFTVCLWQGTWLLPR